VAEVRTGANVDGSKLTAYTRKVLSDLGDASGCPIVFVSSAWRPPSEQARVMYDQASKAVDPTTGLSGLQKARKLYFAPGQKVIDKFVECRSKGLSRDATIAAMTAVIIAVGPGLISKHSSDPTVLGVVDIEPDGPTGLKNPQAFRRAALSARDRGVLSNVIGPPNDPAFHLEIPQPQTRAAA
jgi:hypothetical protein